MQERIRIATPDNVELDFELAGPGSRFLALLVDTLLAAVFLVGLLVLFTRLRLDSFFGIGDALQAWQSALLVLVLFLLRWGYFIFFETCFRGRTPGKMLVGIRTVRDNGLPLGFRHSLIRNLLRVGDTLPPPLYLLGGLSVLISRKGQRLGDLAAGTIVVRERHAAVKEKDGAADFGADWTSKLERGSSRHLVVLPKGPISIRQVSLIEEYFRRAPGLKGELRIRLSWAITRPLLALFDHREEEWENVRDRIGLCEALMREVLELARKAAESTPRYDRVDQDAQQKARTWSTFAARVGRLLQAGKRGLRRLSPEEMKSLLVDYRRITTDLARAQSMEADARTLSRLNRLAAGGHNVLYGYARGGSRLPWREGLVRFAREVRGGLRAVALASFLFAGAAAVSYLAVRWHPELAYELVGPEFYSFKPASAENLHDIPKLIRPVAASAILTNNLQVAILAFAFGLTAGLGTAVLLVINGVHLGSVFGWMGMNGDVRALWGWIMPHGLTEILAILIAGAAGFLLAGAILAPGQHRRPAALKLAAAKALVLELGCMAMLLVAGLIEGFISPSALAYSARIGILAGSAGLWILYFLLAGRRLEQARNPGR